MGCTKVSTHDPYTQATITEKFEKTKPMNFVNPELVSNPAWYYHDYYIRYTTGGTPRVDRVSKDVYSSVFEGKIYVLKWGFIDDFTSNTKEYGYIEIISEAK